MGSCLLAVSRLQLRQRREAMGAEITTRNNSKEPPGRGNVLVGGLIALLQEAEAEGIQAGKDAVRRALIAMLARVVRLLGRRRVGPRKLL